MSVLKEILTNPLFKRALEYEMSTCDNSDVAKKNGIATSLSVAEYVENKEVKSYVVSDTLIEALNVVECDEVGPWHVSGPQAFNFLLKKNLLSDGEHFYNEIYVVIVPPKSEVGYIGNTTENQYSLLIHALSTSSYSEGRYSSYFSTKYESGEGIDKILDRAARTDLGSIKISSEFKSKLLRLTLNLVLYANTPDPDIMKLKPTIYNTKAFKQDYFKLGKNEVPFGIYSMGWDFHGREYKESIGIRNGHWRWQPCGPKWSQRKLIFLKPTTVRYGKGGE